jgi:hypothetical protein
MTSDHPQDAFATNRTRREAREAARFEDASALTAVAGRTITLPSGRPAFQVGVGFEIQSVPTALGYKGSVIPMWKIEEAVREREAVLDAAADVAPDYGCECELDWNCGLHQGGPTAIERQMDEWASRDVDPREAEFQYFDEVRAEEARAEEARRRAENACSDGDRCNGLYSCSKHSWEYQRRFGRAFNE